MNQQNPPRDIATPPKARPGAAPSGTMTFHQEIRTGPLPDPETLARYNDAFPGCAERIVAMAEGQAHHRQGLETVSIKSGVAAQTRGQYIGAAIAIVALACGTFLLYEGKDVGGFVVVGSVATSLAAVWVLGKIVQHRQLKKRSANPPDQE